MSGENLIQIFKTLAVIPSPSLHEDKVADKIVELLQEKGIKTLKDSYGNVIAKIEATDSSKKRLMLSAHMDVVGDNSPVNIVDKDGFIETDKTRTLGADDKAGVAAAILLALETVDTKASHGGLELVFTKDEEHSMTGVNHIKFKNLDSKYILVLDSDKLGQFEVSGAGYTILNIAVEAFKGGHSGLDIEDKERLNAVKLIAEIVDKIPQGVYKKDEFGVVTSINVGSIIGGGVENAIYDAVSGSVKTVNLINYIASNSMSNIINTKAQAHYSIRSSSKECENNLINEINTIADEFNNKYHGLAKATVELPKEHLPIFEKSDDNCMVEIAEKAAKKAGVKLKVSSFHAGAETHIYANRKNSNGENFIPVLMGIADIYNMHSNNEKINAESYKIGYKLLKAFFDEFNS